ncbi:MAG: IclR family transcriptional regulator [Dehalococcoidia bacterium]
MLVPTRGQHREERSLSDSALRALGILERVSSADAGLTAGDVARDLNLSRATVSRLLAALVHDGWLVASGSPRRYTPAFRILTAASGVLRQHPVRELVRPWLSELAERVELPCMLAFYERDHVVVTDVCEVISGRVMLRFVGQAFPIATTAPGKTFLGFLAEEDRQRLAEIEACKPGATTTVPDLLTEASLTRERGYALADRSFRADASGLGVPVIARGGAIVAALVVATLGPLTDTFIETVAPLAVGVAARASLALGYQQVDGFLP